MFDAENGELFWFLPGGLERPENLPLGFSLPLWGRWQPEGLTDEGSAEGGL